MGCGGSVWDGSEEKPAIEFAAGGFISARDASQMEVPDPLGVLVEKGNVISGHDLHVVEIIEHADVWQVDGLQDFQRVIAAIKELTVMIDKRIEWFNVELKALVSGQFACLGEGVSKHIELLLAADPGC